MRIRSLLLLATTIVLVPGFVAAVMAVQKVREGERQAALNALRETVRASALLVDGEIQRSIGALTALGQSDHLRSGNLKAFYEQAKAVDKPPHVWTLLFDEDGVQRINTSVPFGTPLPNAIAAERVKAALATGRPQVSDLIIGPVSGKLLTTLYVPTREGNGRRYVVAQAFSVDHWRDTALQVMNSSQATISVFDRTGRFVSRNLNADQTLGKPARPEVVAAASTATEGLIRHQTLEGMDSYDAFTHSEQTGWTVAVATPVHAIERSANQAVLWLALSGLVALATALAVAGFLGRTFMRVIDNASRAARAVGAGETPALPQGRLAEVKALYAALADAGRALSQERQSRTLAEHERSQLLERETALREAAQKENAAKDQFLALLGHELRNPLAAISGATAVLSHARTPPDAREKFLGIIQRQNHHLSHIVNDLLDVSRLMSGKIVLETRRINLCEWVRSCIEALRATEKAVGHELVVHADGEVWVHGDGVRLEQIVNNLVFNSLKCSPAGTQVIVTVKREGERALLIVQDAGVGIGAELLPHIFEPFVQGPPAPGRISSGLGIGLALVRQLVLLHGGEVRAHSEGEGLGATFVVSLPLADARHDALPGAATGRGSRCVLLVEDDGDAPAAMSELLRLMGHRVVAARNRDEALAAAIAQPVDMALLDLGLPGHDGYQIAAELRQRPGMHGLPLVALTGPGTATDRARALAVGFDAHLSRPVDPDLLARTIDECTAARP